MRRLALALILAAVAVAAAPSQAAEPPPTLVPGVLTVGLNLPTPGFQVGSVLGTQVMVAKGYEIDLARGLAAKLGFKRIAFYQESRFNRIYAPGAKPWDIALAQVSITDARRQNVDFTAPYLRADQGVLLRQGLPKVPRKIADLKQLRLCSQVNTTSVDVIAARIKPAKPPKLYGNVTTLMQNLGQNRCDAVVYDAPALAVLRSQVPQRYGPFAGVIRTRESYGVVLPKGSAADAAGRRRARAAGRVGPARHAREALADDGPREAARPG